MSPSNALLSEEKHRRYEASCMGTVLALIAVLCLSAPAALGQSDNWNGGTGNWSNGGAWSIGVPAPANDVIIYSGGNDLVTLDVGSATINSLTLGGANNGFTSELTDGGSTQNLNISKGLTVGQNGILDLTGIFSAVTAGGDSSNAGNIELVDNSNFSIAGKFSNTGNIFVLGGSEFFVSGPLSNSGILEGGPDSLVGAGAITNSGKSR